MTTTEILTMRNCLNILSYLYFLMLKICCNKKPCFKNNHYRRKKNIIFVKTYYLLTFLLSLYCTRCGCLKIRLMLLQKNCACDKF